MRTRKIKTDGVGRVIVTLCGNNDTLIEIEGRFPGEIKLRPHQVGYVIRALTAALDEAKRRK
jgi:hypothetical protein